MRDLPFFMEKVSRFDRISRRGFTCPSGGFTCPSGGVNRVRGGFNRVRGGFTCHRGVQSERLLICLFLQRTDTVGERIDFPHEHTEYLCAGGNVEFIRFSQYNDHRKQ